MNDLINILLAGSSLLLVFLAFTNPNKINKKGNLWFGFFLVCVFFLSSDSIITALGIAIENIVLQNILAIAGNVLAPIFYLSVCYYIKPNRKWRLSDNLHFLFGVLFFGLIMFALSFAKTSVLTGIENFRATLSIISTIFNFLFFIQLLVYGLLAYKKLRKHQKNIEIYSSNKTNIDLKWLERIIIIVNILILIWIPDMVLNLSSDSFSFINFFLLVGVFFIALHFFQQKEIYPFSENQKKDIIELIEESEVIDVKKKLLDDDKLFLYKQELTKLMQSKKLFLDSEISLVKLAYEMQITPHLLSYIINKGFDENFYQFVNRFRIEEAKLLMKDPSMNYLSLLGIGFEVGFNSKSVFNTTFKKITNQTPSEFKKTHKQLETNALK